jgi:hypothetical protein
MLQYQVPVGLIESKHTLASELRNVMHGSWLQLMDIVQTAQAEQSIDGCHSVCVSNNEDLTKYSHSSTDHLKWTNGYCMYHSLILPYCVCVLYVSSNTQPSYPYFSFTGLPNGSNACPPSVFRWLTIITYQTQLYHWKLCSSGMLCSTDW